MWIKIVVMTIGVYLSAAMGIVYKRKKVIRSRQDGANKNILYTGKER
ncbi:hypothetical protein JYK00_06405 [Thermosipho ferrireducens]|uniref:Uncharacterized protein n=1 Tax=Thermosipho ferrireducens TaxID=2571116 RepID=A0ABX7S6I1_9BACT|nr:hypothetical protein [Thermosipho ferrireducens]QTA37370.1 hypothetical protein JYK00_06405 [Thermosipho ferrireducens]